MFNSTVMTWVFSSTEKNIHVVSQSFFGLNIWSYNVAKLALKARGSACGSQGETTEVRFDVKKHNFASDINISTTNFFPFSQKRYKDPIEM